MERWATQGEAKKRSVKAKTADVVLVKKMDNLTVAENSLKLVPSLDALLLRQLQARRALDVMNRSVAAFPFCFVAIIPTWRISSLDSTATAAAATALKSTSRFCNQGAILV